MTNQIPSDVEKYLREDVRLTVEQLKWVSDRYDRILNGLQEDWYITFFLPEGAKKRRIEAPEPDLKRIQRKVLDRVLYKFGVNRAAHGFVKHRSPVTNAQAHLTHREQIHTKKNYAVLMVDVKDFFHGITEPTVWKTFNLILLRRSRIEDPLIRSRIADVLTGLCVKDGRLPMGAPTSPALSNLAMIPFDQVVSKWCRKRYFCYTRYADDMVVSGPRANRVYTMLASQLDGMGLTLNIKKTRVRRSHRAIDVTGVTINSGMPTVSRKFRRRLRAALHQTQRHVESMRMSEDPRKDLQPEKVSRLIGRASWCSFVNPKHNHLLVHAKEVRRLEEEGIA